MLSKDVSISVVNLDGRSTHDVKGLVGFAKKKMGQYVDLLNSLGQQEGRKSLRLVDGTIINLKPNENFGKVQIMIPTKQPVGRPIIEVSEQKQIIIPTEKITTKKTRGFIIPEVVPCHEVCDENEKLIGFIIAPDFDPIFFIPIPDGVTVPEANLWGEHPVYGDVDYCFGYDGDKLGPDGNMLNPDAFSPEGLHFRDGFWYEISSLPSDNKRISQHEGEATTPEIDTNPPHNGDPFTWPYGSMIANLPEYAWEDPREPGFEGFTPTMGRIASKSFVGAVEMTADWISTNGDRCPSISSVGLQCGSAWKFKRVRKDGETAVYLEDPVDKASSGYDGPVADDLGQSWVSESYIRNTAATWSESFWLMDSFLMTEYAIWASTRDVVSYSNFDNYGDGSCWQDGPDGNKRHLIIRTILTDCWQQDHYISCDAQAGGFLSQLSRIGATELEYEYPPFSTIVDWQPTSEEWTGYTGPDYPYLYHYFDDHIVQDPTEAKWTFQILTDQEQFELLPGKYRRFTAMSNPKRTRIYFDGGYPVYCFSYEYGSDDYTVNEMRYTMGVTDKQGTTWIGKPTEKVIAMPLDPDTSLNRVLDSDGKLFTDEDHPEGFWTGGYFRAVLLTQHGDLPPEKITGKLKLYQTPSVTIEIKKTEEVRRL